MLRPFETHAIRLDFQATDNGITVQKEPSGNTLRSTRLDRYPIICDLEYE
jgi:hypothetical protein